MVARWAVVCLGWWQVATVEVVSMTEAASAMAEAMFLSVMMSSSLARLRTSNTSKSFDTNHGDSIPPLDQVSLRRTRCPFAGPGDPCVLLENNH